MEDDRPDVEDVDDDAEGQALTWKVREPVPEVEEDDAEGQGMRPPPDLAIPGMPGLDEDDDVEGHIGMSGNPRPPVD